MLCPFPWPFPTKDTLSSKDNSNEIVVFFLWSSVCIMEIIFWDLVTLDLHKSNDWLVLIVIVL